MFQQSLVESSALLRRQNRWPAIASVALQASMLAAVLALPLLHPEVLPLGRARLSTLTPPPPAPRPPPPPHPVKIEAAAATNAPVFSAVHPSFARPAPATDAPPVAAPALAFGDSTGKPSSDLLATLASGQPTAPHVVATPAVSHSTAPLRLSTGISAGLLLAPIRPDYPQIARLTRTQGAVVVQAVISSTGHIESAHVVSGPPTLQTAALAAVRSARYRPYLLNGSPTPVETTFTINFHLGD